LTNEVWTLIKHLNEEGLLKHFFFMRYGDTRGLHRKPQYISFRNPFLVALFVSIARNCRTRLSIEEMLPAGDQLTPTGGRVVEFLTQRGMGVRHAG
jgi:hypothetical protein